MPRPLALLTTLLLLLAGLSVAAPAQAYDRDCSDFDTQAQAQRFYVSQGGPQQDPHRLDADGDGRACDSLPCPCSGATSGGSKTPSKPARIVQYAVVTRVVDGDTLNVRLSSGARTSVRMIGIDSPERGRCGYDAATRSLRALARVGAKVTLTSDRTQARQDRYGRILRYVTTRANGRDVNRAQVYRGWAKVYVYGGKPFERTASYRSAQTEAKAAPRGVWRSC